MNIKPSIFFVFLWLLCAFSDRAHAEIRYVAIGDSYSIGTGVTPAEAWPSLLAAQFQKDGVDVKLVANPSRNGWTTVDAMQWEIPVLQKANADFVTVMIGVNDWVQGYPPERFRENFADLLNDVLLIVPDKKKVLIVTIPDFSVTVRGSSFTPGRNISKGIASFNAIITEEAQKREVAVVDIYAVSQAMGLDSSLVARDGLHPSAKGQLLFADTIYPAAKPLLVK